MPSFFLNIIIFLRQSPPRLLILFTLSISLLLTAENAFASGRVNPYPETYLYFDSSPGDYIGQGKFLKVTKENGTFSSKMNYNNSDLGIEIYYNGGKHPSGRLDYWSLKLSAPYNSHRPLSTSIYPLATKFPFNDKAVPGINFSGNHRECNQATGWFVVNEIEYKYNEITYKYDSLKRLSADFVQKCDGGPGLTGSIRYNAIKPHSSLDLAAPLIYFVYYLTQQPSQEDLERLSCSLSFSPATWNDATKECTCDNDTQIWRDGQCLDEFLPVGPPLG